MLKDNRLYSEDVEAAARTIERLGVSQSRILVTGATGLIGSAVVDVLLKMNDIFGAGNVVYATSRSERKALERFGERSDLKAVAYDATKELDFDFPVDYVIHGASNASPDKYVSAPVDTMLSNFLGLFRLMEYAKRVGAKRVLYVSSSEVYGNKTVLSPFKEDDYGRVDILNVRSSYAESKRASETLAAAYSAQFGLDTVMVRPGHVYGPQAQETDKRISSDFARKAARGQELVMKSEGRQMRSYCHALDAATAILTVLVKGERATAYNISNPDSVITIREMAEMLAKAGEVPLRFELPNAAEKAAFNPMENSSLDATRLLALGWKCHFDAESGLRRTVQVLKTEEVR